MATVSRVISGSRPVSADLRARVLQAVELLGYNPSAAARSLRTKRSGVVGVVIPSLSNPFFTELLRAVEHETRRLGYVVLVCSSDHDAQHERLAVNALVSHGVEGALACVADSRHSDLSALGEAGVPFVLVAREIIGQEHDAVVHDDRQAAYDATRHLIESGHERIVIVLHPLRLSTAVKRYEGYRAAHLDRGLPVRDEYVLTEEYDERMGADLVGGVMACSPRPNGLLVCTNLSTRAVFRTVMSLGFRVPEDLAIVGVDDSDWSSMVMPPLTVIHQSPYEIGRLATELLVRRLSGNGDDGATRIVVPSRLVVRASTRRTECSPS